MCAGVCSVDLKIDQGKQFLALVNIRSIEDLKKYKDSIEEDDYYHCRKLFD